MRKHKKIILWLTGCLAALLFLFVGFLLLLPYLINLEPTKEKIMAVLSWQEGGKVEYRKLDLFYFLQPRVKAHQVRISIPGKAEGTLKSIQIYPQLRSLLRGKLGVNKMKLNSLISASDSRKNLKGPQRNGNAPFMRKSGPR